MIGTAEEIWANRGWYVAVFFGEERDRDFDRAVKLLAGRSGFVRLLTPDRRVVHRLICKKEDLPLVWPALSIVSRFSSAKAYICGEEVPTNSLWALSCFAKGITAERPCEAIRSVPLHLGCPQGNVILQANHPKAWYTKAIPIESGLFHIDRTGLIEAFQGRIGDFKWCPLLHYSSLLKTLQKLPEQIDVAAQPFWQVIQQDDIVKLRVRYPEQYDAWLNALLA